jgi:hypothetical protein
VEVEEAAAPRNKCRTILLLLLPTGSTKDESELGGMAALLRQGLGRLLEKIMGGGERERCGG